MNDLVIRVERLSKQYRLGSPQEKYRTMRDMLTGLATAPLRWASRRKGKSDVTESFLALNEISFDVRRGEVVGIIGRNGAGKSTLLKILSRITEPTAGFAEIYGSVGSLLEVGTGFHQELTGRENIFLNGAILGMRRSVIQRRFDEIVAFAEVERFIDTPVKHYSSGMYLRLAFAVAAHLEPDILLVDEVLAVGDIAFQKKCLGKMEDVAEQGRTVLFVSHNMSAIKALCRTGMLLSNGQLVSLGDVGRVIHQYQTSTMQEGHHDADNRRPSRISFGAMQINGSPGGRIHSAEPANLEIAVRSPIEISTYHLSCFITDPGGITVMQSLVDNRMLKCGLIAGTNKFRVVLPVMWLKPGIYSLHFKLMISAADTGGRYLSDPVMLEVDGDERLAGLGGILSPEATWEIQTDSAVVSS